MGRITTSPRFVINIIRQDQLSLEEFGWGGVGI